tara:strand:+ start:3714 stop:5651 length:1938 start_codon:yes stop_codon:yes gene_type:complete
MKLTRGFFLKPIRQFIFIYLALFSLFRIVLSVWQIERFDSFSSMLYVWVQGIRVDLASLGWFMILPALLHCILYGIQSIRPYWLKILKFYLLAGLSFIIFMEMVTPAFIQEYELRPNRLFIEYLIYPKEVFSMLITGYKLEILSTCLISAFVIYKGAQVYPQTIQNLIEPSKKIQFFCAILVLAFGILCARSSFGHRPLNASMVAFSQDPLVNDLILNSSYSLLSAYKNMSAEKNAAYYYGSMSEKEVVTSIRHHIVNKDLMEKESHPSLNLNKASYHGQPKNIVILLQESLGARYVGNLGGLDLTPNLDQIMHEGWALTNLYATGTRSVRGIEAVVTGFTPTPSRAVVKLSKSQTRFFTIAQLLQEKGYFTQFIYGGESHFDNMKSFFLGNGFMDIVDEKDYDHPNFMGSWGVSDEDLYQKAQEKFTAQSQLGQPFFSLVFTSSNHSPFEFPEGRIPLYEQPQATRNNAIYYSDWALGEFIKKAKASSYWDNTIFLIVADHDARVYADHLLPAASFHIPGVFFGKGIEPRRDSRLASSIDMPVTLLSLAGIDAVTPMIGRDLTKSYPVEQERALMQFSHTFGYMTRDKLVVLAPHKSPQAFKYDLQYKTQVAVSISEAEAKVAQAHVLWGSMAYQKGLYAPFKL